MTSGIMNAREFNGSPRSLPREKPFHCVSWAERYAVISQLFDTRDTETMIIEKEEETRNGARAIKSEKKQKKERTGLGEVQAGKKG